MRKEDRKKGSRGNKRGISPVVGVILMVAITVALAAVVASFVYGYGGTLKQKPTPVFSVSRKGDTVSVVLLDKGGAETITRLFVKSPNVTDDSDTDNIDLNDSTPTGEIEIGDTLESVGVSTGDHYVVNATVDGTSRVVIHQWM